VTLPFKTLDDIEYQGKRVLIRVDMNCSIDPDTKKITDDSRIVATIPTLKDLSTSKVVLMAHQGRPGSDDFISLEQHTEILNRLGFKADFVDDIFGEKAKEAIKKVEVGEILVLQNVRMFDGENKTGTIEEVAQKAIVQELYPLFDFFVNDAFGAAHRSQASIVGFTTVLPSVAGRVMEKEIRVLSKVAAKDIHPWNLVLGGSKVPDKVKIIEQLLGIGRADNVLLGGLIGNLFLVAKGVIPEEYGKVIKEYDEVIEIANALLSKYSDTIILPEDAAIDKNGKRVECELDEIEGYPFFDIGPRTADKYVKIIRDSKVVFANGPMGFFEKKDFTHGTVKILEAMAESDSITVVGGGHLGAMAEQMNLLEKITHISTGGGATMKFLTGEQLVLVDALEAAAKRMDD